MDHPKIVKMGANVVITGTDKNAVEAAAQELAAMGAKILLRTERGDRWQLGRGMRRLGANPQMVGRKLKPRARN